MSGIVYVVHCVDTEGPMYEEPTVPFEQIKNVFKLDFDATEENLTKLQSGSMGLGNGLDEAIMELIDPHRRSIGNTWNEIDDQLDFVTSEAYRMKLPDSDGNGWIFSWFCMDHVGFTGENPRNRDAGYHKVFDHYMKLIQKQRRGDIVQFHYHPLPLSGNYNDSGTAYWGSDNLNQILCRRIIDRNWFPVAFRPGFHTERPDSHWFLEQWIPFDYGNQSMKSDFDTRQSDMSDGRFGDWRYAPTEWIPYHPAYDNYQTKGNCKRYITRCLNMYARIRQIEQSDVDDAFACARRGRDTILAFTDHDYKDMRFEIDRIRNMITVSKDKFKDVRFVYSDAVTAMREVLELKHNEAGMDSFILRNENRLIVTTKNSIFGPQPFLAIKDKKGKYYWDNFDFSGYNEWSYTFDHNTIDLKNVERIGVAVTSLYGSVDIKIMDLSLGDENV